MKKIHTHYDNLKVSRSAPPEVIRAAFRSLSQKYHPDRNNDSRSTRIMVLINQAYDVLSDPEKRKKHDHWIKEQEGHTENSNEPKQQIIEYPIPVSGFCKYDDLPESVQAKIKDRINGKDTNQLLIKLNGIVWSYILGAILLSWFVYLYSDAVDYAWDGTTIYWYIGITLVVGILIAICFESIYLWHSTPLRSFLIVSPLYIIKTKHNKLWFWPVWTASNINATHNYRNGTYQETSLSVSLDGKLENFSISSVSTYQSILNSLNTFNSRFRAAEQRLDYNYLKSNDDFLEHRLSTVKPLKSESYKKKLTIYISILFLSLSGYYAAYMINSTRPSKFEATAAYSTPTSYTSIQPREIQNAVPSYIRPATAPNGEAWPHVSGYLNSYHQIRSDGLSNVTIDNTQSDSDVFVKLISIETEIAYPTRIFFVSAHEKFTLRHVSAGKYDVRYRDLNTGNLFGSPPFQLEEIADNDGVRYSNITMTLYKTINGNMETHKIPESEF